MNTAATTAHESSRKALKALRLGVVTSDKREKSRTVEIRRQIRHPKYGKYVALKSKVQVHDEHNESRTGDRVQIAPCRPISKTKGYRLVRVIEKAPRTEL